MTLCCFYLINSLFDKYAPWKAFQKALGDKNKAHVHGDKHERREGHSHEWYMLL